MQPLPQLHTVILTKRLQHNQTDANKGIVIVLADV